MNNELLDKLKKDMLQLLKKESAVYVKSTVCGHVFNLHFPLRKHIVETDKQAKNMLELLMNEMQKKNPIDEDIC